MYIDTWNSLVVRFFYLSLIYYYSVASIRFDIYIYIKIGNIIIFLLDTRASISAIQHHPRRQTTNNQVTRIVVRPRYRHIHSEMLLVFEQNVDAAIFRFGCRPTTNVFNRMFSLFDERYRSHATVKLYTRLRS